jgi:hypothetical protein
MIHTEQHPENQTFLFQVDILVNAQTNGKALEHLLHVLNSGSFADYRINSGITIGQKIESAIQTVKPATNSSVKPKDAAKPNISRTKPETAPPKSASTASKPQVSSIPDELDARIRDFINTNKLIRLNVNKGRGIKLSIPCRVLQFDAATQLLTVYHVDEKQVHTLKLFEIDDFIE